jgi:hypothetical protein
VLRTTSLGRRQRCARPKRRNSEQSGLKHPNRDLAPTSRRCRLLGLLSSRLVADILARSAADPRAYPRVATNRHFRAEAGSPHDLSATGRRRVWLGLAAHSARTSRKAMLTSSGCGPSDAAWSAVDLDEPDVLDEAGRRRPVASMGRMVLASHVLQLVSRYCRRRRQTWPPTYYRVHADGGHGTDGGCILGPWCRWAMINRFCLGTLDEICNDKVLDVAAKVGLLLVPSVAAQPGSASEHQIGFYGDMVGGNEFEQSANRLERFTCADRGKDIVAINAIQGRFRCSSERPGQVGFLHPFLHDHRPHVVRSGPRVESGTFLLPESHMAFCIRPARVLIIISAPLVVAIGIRTPPDSGGDHRRESLPVPTGRPPASHPQWF